MVTVRDNTLNIPEDGYVWEVNGKCEFSAEGRLPDWAETTVYVKAHNTNEAARKGVELMGPRPMVGLYDEHGRK